MARSQPFYAACNGGLALHLSKFDLLDNPGVALRLRNYEVSLRGGYRRVNGFLALGEEEATTPAGVFPILGVHPYGEGVVAVSNTGVYYTEDGESWTQVNKDTEPTGAVIGDLAALPTLARADQGQAQFVLAKGTDNHVGNPFGVLYIATGPNPLAHFRIEGAGPSRTFHYKEITTPANAKWIAEIDQHLCVVDNVLEPNTINFSTLRNYDDFSGVGSGSVSGTSIVEGIKPFRDILYIFSRQGIKKLVEINNPEATAIVDVTDKLGCISGYSIQELGGDLVFLSLDGIRSVAATERIDDVELGNISPGIQALISPLSEDIDQYVVSSCVIASKNQYRLFFINQGHIAQGFCGTLVTSTEGSRGFQWSELRGIDVRSISSGTTVDGDEVTYHGDDFGFVFTHDVGSSFNGRNVLAEWHAPDVHMGDLGARKTLNYIKPSLQREGPYSISLGVSFDDRSPTIIAPSPYVISDSTTISIFGFAVFGESVFGSTSQSLDRVPLQGSGYTVALRFTSNGVGQPYTIHGYHLEFTPSGRR